MTSTIDDAARYRDLSVRERVDRFFGFIGGRSRRIGVTFSVANQEASCAAMAWSQSTSMEEVRFLLGYIEKRGWIETVEAAQYS